ncbi:MAG: 2-hydroxyacyl-CoA dehydratase [Clostridiales bacterium]|nr:2-hydroxyacyl-CoA dehydratase [Clostridiales bacterium]
MAKDTRLEDAVLRGEMSIVDFCCEKVNGQIERMKERNPDLLWTLEIQRAMWEMFRDGHKNGKKVIWFGGPVPVDLIVAFDCVPVYLDTVPIRLSPNPVLAARFIDAAEKYVPNSMCGIDKVELGMTLLNQFGPEPDAFVYSSVPCDSSRIAYPNMDMILTKKGTPCFAFDTPFRRDERGIQYLVDQTKRFISWMEELTGTKFDQEKYNEVCKKTNRTFEWQGKCAELRMRKPCPLPGRMLVLNGTSNAMSGFDAMGDLLEKEYEVGEMLYELGMGPCPEGEKHRVALLQNMLWSSAGTMDWLEREYNTVAVMDAFGFQYGDIYEHIGDLEDCLRVMARKMQNNPMIHGASGPSENFIYLVDKIFENYEPDVSMFIGHIGCKHTWASAKMVTDMIQEKYGIPSLYIDVDGIDGRYKSLDEIKASVADYMDTVVNK